MLRRTRRQIAILTNEGMAVSKGREKGEMYIRPHEGDERTMEGEEGQRFKAENDY
jgi:hypothetical protein